MSRVSPARRVAYDVLRAVHSGDAYANLLLPSRIREARLSPADAALATELSYGALRMQGYDDRVIALAARRPVDRIDPEVLDALRLGVRQLLGMRIPAHAAVDESVSLVVAARRRSASGFANGVLRAVARTSPEEWRERVLDGLSGDERLAAESAHPAWIVGALRDALAAEGTAAEGAEAELPALLAADNEPPRVALVALPGLAEPSELGAPGSVSPVAAASRGGDPAAIPLVAAGRGRVQDEGSQLAALALSRARRVRPGERWLDLCAGPGGKAALLAAEARTGGAVLEANELVPARAGLVRRALEAFAGPDGTGAPVVHEGDGVAFAAAHPGEFDRILLDAPCTGLGALRRRPEARWRKRPSDLAALTRLQARLLDAAAGALRPGGILAYVTCSPHLAETREQVAAALAGHPELRALDTPAVLAGVAIRDLGLPDATGAQLWPHRHGTDAMFVQLLGSAGSP